MSVCVWGHGIWGLGCISFISVLGPDSFCSLLCISQDEGWKFLNEAKKLGLVLWVEEAPEQGGPSGLLFEEGLFFGEEILALEV